MKPLKTIKETNFEVFVDGACNSADTFMPLVEDFVEQLPELMPDVWDIVEPFKRPFTVQNVRETISSWPGAQFDFFWKRKTVPKAWGVFSRLVWNARGARHAHIRMYVNLSRDLEKRIITYLKHTSIKFGGHYGYFDTLVGQYRDTGLKNKAAPGAMAIHIPSHQLQTFLPDILWSQVFGPPYVRLFGLEKLLSAPAYRVEQLGPETVYIQLSESLFDMHERYETVDAIRQQVKAHLDDNIFFKADNPEGHVYRTPDFQFPPDPNPVPLYSTVMAARSSR
ncbi:MAG TPA: hypothetical protein VJ654_07430 [Noviherbaspirillum sp.]|nr:hypothetical protein [Noviherbaspirillum sp.]